jgi:hypothetical protein
MALAAMANWPGTDRLFQYDFILGPLGVQVRSDDLAVGQHMQMICVYFGLEPVTTLPPEKPLTLQWCAHDSGLTIPASAVCVAEQQGLTALQDDQQLYLSDGVSTVQIDPQAGMARGSVRATRCRPVPCFRKDLLLYSLLFLLRYRDYYGLHGAAVARDGMGCLLVADSGCGKSTLALSLVCQGWSYLSDDSLLLYQHDDRIATRALRRDLCLDAEAARYFPDIMPDWVPCPLADAGKQRLDMGACYAGQMVPTCIPQVLVFPEITTDTRSRLVPVGKTEAFSRLLSQSLCVLFEPDWMPRHIEILTRLVQQASAYHLSAGRDLAREPALITSILADI